MVPATVECVVRATLETSGGQPTHCRISARHTVLEEMSSISKIVLGAGACSLVFLKDNNISEQPEVEF